MKKAKKLISLLLALTMLLSMIPMAVAAGDAADDVATYSATPEVKIIRSTLDGHWVKFGTVTNPLQGKSESASYTQAVGEQDNYQLLPISTVNGNLYSPVAYYVPQTGSVTVSNDGIIDDLSFSMEPYYRTTGGFYDTPSLQFNFKAVAAGSTTVKVTYYYNFNVSNVVNGTKWYKSVSTFSITVLDEQVQKPDKPTVSDVERFRNYVNSTSSSKGAVYMWCDESLYDHGAWFDYLTEVPGAYTLGEVTANDGSVMSAINYPWTCTMTIDANKYLEAYNSKLAGKVGQHYLKENEPEFQTVTWYYRAGEYKWKYIADDAPIYIDITHDKPVTEETYVLHYDANGGEGAPASQTTKSNTGKATFTVSSAIPTRDGYTFLGWADEADATAAQYHGGDKITLTKDNPTKTIYAVWEAKNPQPPLIPAPSYDDLKSAIGQIQVKDVSTPSCGTENYDLIDNTESEPFNWTKTARADQPGKYDVTIKTAPYVAKYNSEKTKTHELNNANQTTLKLVISYENNKWVLDDGLRVIEVKHSEQNPPTDIPNPNPGNIAESLKVKVVCTTTNSGHDPAFYSLIDGTFTHTDIEQSGDYPTCSITISPDKYISRYSTDKNCQHTTPDDPKTVPLLWNKEAQKWAVNDDQIGLNGVVFNAVCEAVPDTFTVTYTDGVEDEVIFENDVHTGLNAGDATPAFVGGTPNREGYTFAGWEPEVTETVTETVTYVAKWTPVEPKAPTADELKKLEMAVQVKCVVDASQQHKEAYDLLGEYDKDYFVGEPRKDGDDWLCDISYDSDLYVAAFNTTFQNLKHVQNGEKIDPVTLIWDGGSWQVKTQGRVHVTEVYTVTYTDGVDGEEVFVDQVYSDLRKDSTTPAFDGTPTRTGYTFAGWEPKVAETVTEDVLYVAMWTPVEPEAPTADELEKLEMAVLVKCVVDNSQQHTEAYGLLGECDEDYFVGEPRKDGDDWLCDISYYPERYVAAFNTTFQNLKHVQNDEKIVPVTLIWAGDSWQIKEQGRVPVTEVYTVTYTDGVENEEVFADQVYSDLRKDSTTPAFNGTPTRTGYTFAGWEPEVAATVTQTVTYVAKWEKKTYKVVAKLYVNGKPAYYQNEDFYTYKVSGLYGENIDFDTIKAEAVEQAKQIKKASASYTAVILEDHEPNPVCTTFGEHQPGQATHYVKVNVKTEENVVIFQSFEGKTDLTKLHTTTAPYGTSVVEFLNGLGLDLDVAGYTLDTAEDGNTNWYKKDSPKWTFGANDTINGWTNVLLKYTITPHNIYAFARLNSYFAPLTTKEFDTPITLNEATLSRLGLGSYNSLGYISIGSFTFDAMPLTGDLYFGDDAELSAVAEKLATDIALETGVSDKIAEKIAWTALYKTVNEEDMAPGYPAEAGYQLSGNLNLATVMFEANGENVTGMPAVNYTYDDILEIHDFYFTGDTFTMPADPTREGYIFEGWSVKVLPAENDADHLDADGADDAADETLLKAGGTYTITAGGVIFTAQWEARTDTPYTVEHYLENLDGSYALDTTEPLKGTTDTTVTAAAKSYDNFTYDSTVRGTVASGNIAGDGSLVLKLFYTRNTYDYTVRHIKQLPDGSYDEANAEVETLSGKFEALAAVTAKDYGSHYPTNDADTKQNIKIEKNLTIDVKYDLDNHTLTFETNGGSTIAPVTVRHGNAVARPADPTKDKYTFIGWYVDPEFTEEYDFATVLEADKTIYAKFELTSTPIGDIYVRYDVLHIKQLPDGSYDLANAEVEHLSAKKDTTVTAVVKDYRATHHINVNSTLSKLTDTAIQPYPGADGKPVYTILSVYYDLDFHTLTFDTMGGSRIDPVTVRHGNAVAKPKDPVNGGYIFDGWYTDKTYRTPYNFATVLTQDTTIYAKWFLIALPGVTIKKTTPKLNTSDHFAYVQGYPDGTVKPAGNITRAETAAILFRLMDEGSRKTYYSTKSGFRDVATGSWYNTYVATLNNAGVITDSSNGYFRPNEAITRAELAAMLANFTETAGAANYFNDVSARYWAANAIAICAKLGWITGYPDGSFRPDRNVTRAELMAMINRATGRAPKSADAFLPGMKTWSDNTADKWYYLDVQEATNSHSYTVKDSEKWTALNADPNWSLYE